MFYVSAFLFYVGFVSGMFSFVLFVCVLFPVLLSDYENECFSASLVF